MNFRPRLSDRIHTNDIHEILCIIQGSSSLKQELYDLLYDGDELVSYQTAWVLTHFNTEENKWLSEKRDELIDMAITCRHPGRRRLILGLIYKQPLSEPIRIDFLEYCLERMISKKELPAVNSICIKLAYELCRNTPELLQELRTILEFMEPDLLPPSIQASRRKVLNAISSLKNPKNH